MAIGDFSQGKMARLMLRQGIPLMMAELINVLYNVVDRVYIGRLGENSYALTGVGVCLPLITMVMAFANLAGSGGTPLFSIARGRGDDLEAERILGNCVTLLLIFAFFLLIFFEFFQRPLLTLLGASDITLSYAVSYFTIYLLGTFFVLLTVGLNNMINAQGFPGMGMGVTALGAGINIALDPVFIFALGMGVRGAAIATVISQGAAAFATVRFLTGGRALIRIRHSAMVISARRVKKIASLGMSGFTMSVTNSVVQMACNAALERYGGDIYVGIMTVINATREIIQQPSYAFATAGKPILGFNYGAGRRDRVRQGIRDMSAIVLIYTAAVWVFVSVFPQLFIHLFGGGGEILSLGVTSMRIYFSGFIFMGFMLIGQSVFTGLGRAREAVFFSVLRKVIIVLPLTWLLPVAGMGARGVFWAEPISNVSGGIICFLAMIFMIYRKMGKSGAGRQPGSV